MLKNVDKATVYTGKACGKLSRKPVALCVCMMRNWRFQEMLQLSLNS